ncbi:curli-like amyloid fiber formation chaperone CsgH [Hyphomonas sp.]|jgi:hypothetical protein|uniref:curli-like amyloid fiber formation chaperone CsgH n=1 Tax=Hyphomonas sp. TaxID=87 RepID=UPI00391C849A
MYKLVTLSALALVSACTAQTQPVVYTAAPPVAAPAYSPRAACDIRTTRTPQGLRLEAVAQAGRAVYGSYDFMISAQSSSGSSDVNQGGPLELAAGRSATLGAAEIPRGRYRAVLTLRDAGGEVCRVVRKS